MQSNLRKIIDMLKDSDPEVQKSALRAVAVLVPYGKIIFRDSTQPPTLLR
jgi:hypothetical protein